MILCIIKNNLLLQQIDTVLKKYRIIHVINIQEALNEISKYNFDFIFFDPDLIDNFDFFLITVRKNFNSSLIALTNYDSKIIYKHIDDVFFLPISNQFLEQKFKFLINQREFKIAEQKININDDFSLICLDKIYEDLERFKFLTNENNCLNFYLINLEWEINLLNLNIIHNITEKIIENYLNISYLFAQFFNCDLQIIYENDFDILLLNNSQRKIFLQVLLSIIRLLIKSGELKIFLYKDENIPKIKTTINILDSINECQYASILMKNLLKKNQHIICLNNEIKFLI